MPLQVESQVVASAETAIAVAAFERLCSSVFPEKIKLFKLFDKYKHKYKCKYKHKYKHTCSGASAHQTLRTSTHSRPNCSGTASLLQLFFSISIIKGFFCFSAVFFHDFQHIHHIHPNNCTDKASLMQPSNRYRSGPTLVQFSMSPYTY